MYRGHNVPYKSQGENLHFLFHFPCVTKQKAWIAMWLSVKLNVYQVQGQIALHVSEYTKDFTAKHFSLLQRITATRGPLLAEATMNEWKCNIKQHSIDWRSMALLDLSKEQLLLPTFRSSQQWCCFITPVFQININKEASPL